ncbi:hypothetical protein Q4508_18965 [Amphritea sp. 2_MG-2023]|uniref:hypothetical protein n=1 Tax=Amphritea TaxID=515417 RepID=UPI001C069298|nr:MULTISPECIES: hypothetical protein [Amphritea]MBU2967222.1 hypothetical protein [Amphritea atlantica]MDO6420639.1 hypothetical protein [Amphritea sp. 2_MG-2023]
MTNVISFRPREGLEAGKQVKEFIAWTKGLTGFNKPDLPLDWDAWSWKVWMGVSLDFVKLGVSSRKKSFDPSKELLDPQIIDFAKAYVLQQQSLNITKNIQEVVAVRAVEAALLELEPKADITRVNMHVYDRASELIKENFKGDSAYRIGGQLQKLSEFIVEKGLSENSDTWVNLIKRPNDAHGHVKNKKDAEKKMPTQEALDALAEIWSAQPTDHRDIFVTSNCALLLSSPGRVGELNLLAADSLTYKDNSEGEPELFINWYGQKGYGFTDKPVPEVWKEFTLESVRRLKEISEEPRKLAKWLEENPDKFPIHENCPKVDQDAPLTPKQVLDALCVDALNQAPRVKLKAWITATLKVLNKSPEYLESKAILQEQFDSMYNGRWSEGKEDTHTLTLRKLNVYLREYWLPPYFPYTDGSKKMKYQYALNCYFEGQFNTSGGGYLKPFSLQAIDSNTLNSSLSIKKDSDKRSYNLNIFRRWGYKGEAYSMTTHQFRHYLNTIAAKGKIGEVEIARWSGRLDISQNKVYNHISDEERVESARGLGLGSQSTGLATLSSKHQPILLKDLAIAEDRVAHYTAYGVCVHDFAVEPCTKFRDCLTCKKHKCIKGDVEKERRIRLFRDGLEQTLKQATQGVEQEFYGADRWLTYSMDRLEKVNSLIEILENPEIEEGAVIECTDNGYSALKKGLAAQGKLPTLDAPTIGSTTPKPQADLSKLTALLGR